MNIWLPIITNLVIVAFLIISIFIGKKNGLSLELSKFLILTPLLIGTYFLIPLVTKELLKIEALQILNIELIIRSSLWLIFFIIEYGLVNIIVHMIKVHCRKKEMNYVKPIKTRGMDKESTKELKKQQKELAKLNESQKSKLSKAFGIVLSLTIALVGTFIMMLPCKYIFNEVAEKKPEIQEINSGYEYTVYGQLDKITSEKITNFLIHK